MAEGCWISTLVQQPAHSEVRVTCCAGIGSIKAADDEGGAPVLAVDEEGLALPVTRRTASRPMGDGLFWTAEVGTGSPSASPCRTPRLLGQELGGSKQAASPKGPCAAAREPRSIAKPLRDSSPAPPFLPGVLPPLDAARPAQPAPAHVWPSLPYLAACLQDLARHAHLLPELPPPSGAAAPAASLGGAAAPSGIKEVRQPPRPLFGANMLCLPPPEATQELGRCLSCKEAQAEAEVEGSWARAEAQEEVELPEKVAELVRAGADAESEVSPMSENPACDMILYPWEVEMGTGLETDLLRLPSPAAERPPEEAPEAPWKSEGDEGCVGTARRSDVFVVVLNRSGRQPIGLDTQPLVSSVTGALRVAKVKDFGLVSEWNAAVRKTGVGRKVEEGDLIVEVNGASHDSQLLYEAISRSGRLELTLMRMRNPNDHARKRSHSHRRSASRSSTGGSLPTSDPSAREPEAWRGGRRRRGGC